MLNPAIVQEVYRLLEEGKLSHRRIAKATGISRTSVGAIANGRRPDYAQPPSEEFPLFTGPALRCSGCGGMVYMPCQLCQVRAMKRKEKARKILRRRWQMGLALPSGMRCA